MIQLPRPLSLAFRHWLSVTLPLTIILFSTVTAEYKVHFLDGPWSMGNVYGFPLLFAHMSAVVSLEPVYGILGLCIDFVVYGAFVFGAERIVTHIASRKLVQIMSYQTWLITVWVLAIICITIFAFYLSNAFFTFSMKTYGDRLEYQGVHIGIHPL